MAGPDARSWVSGSLWARLFCSKQFAAARAGYRGPDCRGGADKGAMVAMRDVRDVQSLADFDRAIKAGSEARLPAAALAAGRAAPQQP